MNKGTDIEELIASIKPVLKIPLDKTQKQSDALQAIDRLSDLLTLPAVDALIAALEQAQQYAKQRDEENQDLMLTIGRLRVEREQLEASKLSVKLPDGFTIRHGHPINEDERSVMMPKDGGDWLYRFDVEHAIRVAGGTVEGGERDGS